MYQESAINNTILYLVLKIALFILTLLKIFNILNIDSRTLVSSV